MREETREQLEQRARAAVDVCPRCKNLQPGQKAARVAEVVREVEAVRRRPRQQIPDAAWPGGVRLKGRAGVLVREAHRKSFDKALGKRLAAMEAAA